MPPLDLLRTLPTERRSVMHANRLIELLEHYLVPRFCIVEVPRTDIPTLRLDQAVPHEPQSGSGKLLVRLVIRNEL
jgi:hypothetical protein